MNIMTTIKTIIKDSDVLLELEARQYEHYNELTLQTYHYNDKEEVFVHLDDTEIQQLKQFLNKHF